MKQWAILVAFAIALSGCSDDEPVDPAAGCDLEMNYLDADNNCTPHDEPEMVVNGMPDSLQAYSTAEFTWDLDPGTRGQDGEVVHSMDSRIKASLDATAPTNVTGPDDWGTEIEREQHKDFPQNFTGSISWEETGTLYVYGFMLINGQNIWQDLGTIEITPVVATGNYTDITISGFPASTSDAEPSVTVGDGIRWTNNANYDLIITFDGDDCPDGGALSAGSSFEADFLVPGNCAYTMSSPASGLGASQGDISGQVIISKP